jgi:hypothetical protein
LCNFSKQPLAMLSRLSHSSIGPLIDRIPTNIGHIHKMRPQYDNKIHQNNNFLIFCKVFCQFLQQYLTL